MYRRVARIGAKAVHLNAPKPNVGASLLAKAACQATSAVTDIPLSRAGSLPQEMGVVSEKAHQGSDDGFGCVFLNEVAGVGNRVEL